MGFNSAFKGLMKYTVLYMYGFYELQNKTLVVTEAGISSPAE